MAVVAALLFERFNTCKAPLAVVLWITVHNMEES